VLSASVLSASVLSASVLSAVHQPPARARTPAGRSETGHPVR